jgi:hypothetical protein
MLRFKGFIFDLFVAFTKALFAERRMPSRARAFATVRRRRHSA